MDLKQASRSASYAYSSELRIYSPSVARQQVKLESAFKPGKNKCSLVPLASEPADIIHYLSFQASHKGFSSFSLSGKYWHVSSSSGLAKVS